MGLLAMNSLHKNHVLAKQNRSSRHSRCVQATSNRHMHFLSLFVMCYQGRSQPIDLWTPGVQTFGFITLLLVITYG